MVKLAKTKGIFKHEKYGHLNVEIKGLPATVKDVTDVVFKIAHIAEVPLTAVKKTNSPHQYSKSSLIRH